MISKDRAASRFLQIAALDETVRLTDDAIAKVDSEIDEAKGRRSDLVRVRRDALDDIRRAARDEGQLPLFADIDHALSVAPIGALLP